MIVVVLVKEEFIFEKKRKMLLLRGLELPFLKTIKKKIWMHSDLLSIPQSENKNVTTLQWDQ